MLTHNIQGAADIGIPVRLLVDVVSEKSSDFYKRLIHFCVNSKQVSVSSMLVRCELSDLVNTVHVKSLCMRPYGNTLQRLVWF